MDQAFFLSEACRISPGFRHPAFLPMNESSLENKVPGHHSSKCLFSVHEQEIPGQSRCGKGWPQGVALLACLPCWAGLGLGLARGDAWLCGSPLQCSLHSSEGAWGWYPHPCLPEPVGMGFAPAQAAMQVIGEGLGLVHRLRVD